MAKRKPDQKEPGPQPEKKGREAYHTPVMLEEAMEGLKIDPHGTYVDCTFGGGGHARAILERLATDGRLFAFDQDADAKLHLPQDERIIFIPHNFRHLRRMLRLHQTDKVDGILADLGVSSHQLDEPSRGFSTRFAGMLDMRMDKRQALTADRVLNTYSEAALQKVFGEYGEVTNAKTLARTIVGIRRTVPLHSSEAFKTAIQQQVKGNPNRYFAQVFQALRMEVNDELGALKELLLDAPDLLKPGGRIVIISFHSLEDRLVKLSFRKRSLAADDPRNPFGQKPVRSSLQAITKKPLIPTDEEIRNNNRARSARMRIAEKMEENA